MLKDLLAIVDDAELSASAIDAAVTFAELHDAHLALTVLTEQPVLVAAFDPRLFLAGTGPTGRACAPLVCNP